MTDDLPARAPDRDASSDAHPHGVARSQRIDALSRLLEVSKRINSSLDKREVVDHIITSAQEVMGADAASLMLREGDELVFEVALGRASGMLVGKGTRLPLGQGIAGWVASTGEALMFDDVYDDARFCRDYDKATGYRTRSMLCVPLRVAGEVIGVAQVINKRGDDGASVPFTAADKGTFTTFCELAAIAIERAQLHRLLLDKQRTDRDLELARAIQQSFLVHQFPRQDRLAFKATNLPARYVGGDFYDAFELGSTPRRRETDRAAAGQPHERRAASGRIGIAIGDVSGKGAVAALYMARFMSEFRFLAELSSAPDAALERANEILALRSTRGMFITLMYLAIDADTLAVELTNAGHPPALLYDATRTRIERIGTTAGPPLGVVSGQVFPIERFALPPGGGIVLFTDGAIEARNSRGEEYGLDRLVRAIEGAGADVHGSILANILAFTGGLAPHDDLTLLTIQAVAP